MSVRILTLEPGSVSRISIRGVSVQGKIGAAGTLRYVPKKTRARPRGGRGRALDFLIE